MKFRAKTGMSPPIRCRAIIEMLGAPKGYIEKTLQEYMQKLKNEGARISAETYAEATAADKLFSTFVEFTITFDALHQLLTFCFESMPSSIEIFEPDALALPSNELTGFLCDLQARLHEADMIIKTSNAKYKSLDTNATNVFYNFIKYILKQGSKTPQELAGHLGLTEKEVLPFLAELQKREQVTFEDNLCILR